MESIIVPASSSKGFVWTHFPYMAVDGKEVEVKPLFQVYLEFFEKSYTPKQAEIITGVPAKKIERLAREIASHPRNMKLAQGMGVNQYQHA